MAYQAQGVLHKIFDTERKSETFQTREFILEISESQYPQLIKFQLTQDKCDLIENYATGDQINVHFDLRGREWNERFFTNLQCWKIEAQSDSDNAGPSGFSEADQPAKPAASPTTGKQNAFDDEDIPF